ncbi:MAG: hypothetical protein U1E14_08615 [Geminicoccaceae bacterium]
MDPTVCNPLYNIRRTVAREPLPGGGTAEVVTAIRIETALPLVITQDSAATGGSGPLYLPDSASIHIVADDLTIDGALAFPGREVSIFARVLRARAGKAGPRLSVDGAPPEIRATQLTPPLRQRPEQVDAGEKGSPGYSDRVVGPGGGNDQRDGGPGWSATDHAAAMNGRDGGAGADRDGTVDGGGAVIERRGDAGSLFLCCDRTAFPPGIVLALSAEGGAGEPGQPGQDGAIGGPGGDGFDGVVRVPGISYTPPTRGGPGGRGGSGGRGGDGGKGGRGGTIAVYCASGTPAVACSAAGGASQPGRGGRGGKGGDRGRGGRGLLFNVAFYNTKVRVEAGADGAVGEDGADGHDGESRPGTPGTVTVRSGAMSTEALTRLTSVAQLQMVFEAARADYLATPLPGPRPLRLVAVADAGKLPGRQDAGTVEIGLVGSRLQVRLFAADGRPELTWTDLATRDDAADTLRRFLAALPLRQLLTAGWAGPGAPAKLAAQDRALLQQRYAALTSEPAGELAKTSDDDLVGRAANALILLGSGLHDRAWLASKTSDWQRNELIVATNQRTGRSVGELQGMGNLRLAAAALEWAAWPGDAATSDALLPQVLDVLPPQVVLAFDWTVSGAAPALEEAQRTALAETLAAVSSTSARELLALPDPALAGAAAVATLLLASGLGDAATLAQGTPDGHRNILIDALNKRWGRDVGTLQGMSSLRLAREGIGLLDWRTWQARLRSLDAGAEPVAAVRRSLEVAPGVPLQADWTAPPDRPLAAADRSALIAWLAATTAIPADYAGRLPDQAVARWGAVASLLQATGIRQPQVLTSLSGSSMLLALKEANRARSGGHDDEGGAIRVEDELNAALRWFDWPKALLEAMTEEVRQDLVARALALIGYTDPWSDIGERLGWVSRLAIGVANDGDSDRDRRELAAALRNAAYPTLERYGRGYDYFGKGADFAPEMSFGSYDSALAEAIGDSTRYFPTIETYYGRYFAKLGAQQDAHASLGDALTNYGVQQTFVTTNVTNNATQIGNALQAIDAADAAANADRAKLKAALAGLEAKIDAAFGLSVETLFNCLSQLSFVNASEPIHAIETISKVGGAASAGAMAVSQLGAMINEAANSVLDDFGEPVRKELLLRQVKVIEGDLDLRTQLKELAGGYISADASNRLLVQLEKFRELCDRFRKSLGGAAVTRDLDRYIATMTRRNEQIDRYNALLRERVELLAEQRRLAVQQRAVGTQQSQRTDPGLPAMSAYVSGLYERAKADVLQTLYNAYRAHAFWALQPTGGFRNLLGDNPRAIGSLQLQGARSALRSQIRQGFEANPNPRSRFRRTTARRDASSC